MFYFTTYFDKNYLSRGIVLYNSLQENCNNFELYILCLDDYTENYFKENQQQYPSVKTLLLSDLETVDTELKAIKTERSTIEYYFTLSPCLPLYLLKNFNLSHICSLDADILFLSNPAPLFDYLLDYSIIITPHKFSPEIKQLEKFGIYNVSFQIFKNDTNGITCLETWRKQCIDWCEDAFDEVNDRFADQKYLDNWMKLFPNKVKELYDNVSGLAPWNLNNYSIKVKNEKFYSNDERIIFFHFHHFKLLQKKIATNGFYFYKAKSYKALNRLYLNYWNKIEAIDKFFGKNKDVITRTHLSGDNILQTKLNNEGSAFIRISKSKILFANFQKLSGKIIKFMIKLYA